MISVADILGNSLSHGRIIKVFFTVEIQTEHWIGSGVTYCKSFSPNLYVFLRCFSITIFLSVQGNPSVFPIPGFDLHCLSCSELWSFHLLFLVILWIVCGESVYSNLQWTASVSYVPVKCLVHSNLINYCGCIKLYRIIRADERTENEKWCKRLRWRRNMPTECQVIFQSDEKFLCKVLM